MSYRMVTEELDSLMAQYDIPASYDTIDVCNTWTGGDYNTVTTLAGSSENAIAIPDTVQGVTYSAGTLAATGADGSSVESGFSPAPTMFDFVGADSAQRQASFDAPYYGVYGGGSGGDPGGGEDPGDQEIGLRACGTATNGACGSPSRLDRWRGISPMAARADTGRRFTRHGVRRRGVRALVDDREEIPPTPEGHRRFRKLKDGEESILTLDARTELLIGEEMRTAAHTMKARHVWKRVPNGFVRRRTEVDDEEVIDGKRYRNRSVVNFQNVRIGGVAVDPAAP